MTMKPLIALIICGVFFTAKVDAQAQPKREWGPEQATGAPDTMEDGDLPTAWASLEPDAGEELLEVSFEKLVEIDEVRIRETFNPGAVCKIVAISNDKNEIVLWEGEGNPMQAPADMVVRPVLGIKSKQIKIYFDTKRVRGWNEIDAVELVGVDGSRQWATRATASSYYGQNSGLAASDGLNALVLIQAGNMPKDSELRGQRIPAFQISRFETTFGEWKEVQFWAVANGYTFDNGGSGATDRHPVANVSWYDVVKWCNAKSEMEGLTPVYSINGTTYRQGQVHPSLNPAAEGYRLPLMKEWEFAARGGANSQNYTFSGSNNIQEVAWFLGNSNSSASPVGRKKPNESGLYDMSGNLEEWCWEKGRTLGGNFFDPADRIIVVPPNFGTGGEPDYKFGHFGFRYARNAVSDTTAPSNLTEMVPVQGGTLPQGSELAGQTVDSFQIGKYEVTWSEWKAVRDWAVTNNKGYDLANIGAGSGDNHPVRNVNWYDVVKWCNAKSQMEGLTPVYQFGQATYKTGQSTPSVDESADGYRLPLEKEWEWAARGGTRSKSFIYSGSNEVNVVAWYDGNSLNSPVLIENGRGTWPIGQKAPNELGLFDMSGNVFEWCWDLDQIQNRYLRGGGWHYYGQNACRVADRSITRTQNTSDTYLGFRYARNAVSDTSAPSNLTEMVQVQGGTLPQGSELAGQVVDSFQIGKYEVTWGLWKEVRDWAVVNNKGYDLVDIGNTYPKGMANNFPVVYVSWYDAVKWCNARSEKEGLVPVYQVNLETYRNGQMVPVVNSAANGYRLPIDKEWEWAARGGLSSKGYTYSGSNDPDAVAWTQENTKRESKVVGSKLPNELGIYDMSGNVFEWCWDKVNAIRKLRGGGWFFPVEKSTVSRADGLNPDGRYGPFGFRVAKNIANN